MDIYSVKRYRINDRLRRAIREHPFSLNKMNKVLGFEVRNVYFTNISIKEDNLQKLQSLLRINFDLKEIKFDFTKNLGAHAFSQPIKKTRLSKNLSEFIGIMLGDGCIYKNQIHISFDKRNKKYIDYVKKLTKNIFDIDLRTKSIKNTNQFHLYYYNKYLVEKLLEMGLKRGHKIKNQIGVPVWIKENENFAKMCIRGLIDTDGCIYKCKRENQIYIKFTNFNQQLLNDFKEITEGLGYAFAKANRNNWCLYRKDQVAKFIKEIKPLKSIYGAVGKSGILTGLGPVVPGSNPGGAIFNIK